MVAHRRGRLAVPRHEATHDARGAFRERRGFGRPRGVGDPASSDSLLRLVALSPLSAIRYPDEVATPARRKTSFEIDFGKVESAKEILGTHTLTDTVDAALDEVIRLRQRRRLVELLFTPGRLQLDDPEVMAGAWR